MDKRELPSKELASEKLNGRMRIALHLGYIALLWSAAIFITLRSLNIGLPSLEKSTPGDLTALLFGASSVALIIYSAIIGIIAVKGYDRLKKDAADEVQIAMLARIGKLEKELRGRVSSSIGLMLGVSHARPDKPSEEERLDYLAESIAHSKSAYVALKEVESKAQFTALNNVIYYSCVLSKAPDKDYLLKKSEELREFSQNNLPEPFWEGLLTYCRAVLDLSEDKTQIARAYRISAGLLTERLNERQKNEAAYYAASLKERM